MLPVVVIYGPRVASSIWHGIRQVTVSQPSASVRHHDAWHLAFRRICFLHKIFSIMFRHVQAGITYLAIMTAAMAVTFFIPLDSFMGLLPCLLVLSWLGAPCTALRRTLTGGDGELVLPDAGWIISTLPLQCMIGWFFIGNHFPSLPSKLLMMVHLIARFDCILISTYVFRLLMASVFTQLGQIFTGSQPVGLPINIQLNRDDNTRVVRQVTILGIPTNPPIMAHEGRLVHWRIHLRWSLAKVKINLRSVALDTVKRSRTDPVVEIHVRSRPRMFSKEAKQYWIFDLPVIQQDDLNTVDSFINLVVRKQRHRYQYDGNGSGCLSWCRRVVQDFAEVGWVEQRAEERFAEFVDNVRANNSAGYFIPEDEGIFL